MNIRAKINGYEMKDKESDFRFLKEFLFILAIIPLLLSVDYSRFKREKVHVKEGDFSIETSVILLTKKKRVNKELTYHWYKSRSINSTKGGYSGNLLDGNFDKFSLAKNLVEQGKFKKGLKCGEWKTWFDNGELKTICFYRKGLKHGKELIYNAKGIVISEVKYSKGVQVF